LRRRKLKVGVIGSPDLTMTDLATAIEPFLVKTIIAQRGISPMVATNKLALALQMHVTEPPVEIPDDLDPIPQIARRRAILQSILDNSDLILVEADYQTKKPDLFELVLRSRRPITLFWREATIPFSPGQRDLLGHEAKLEPQPV